MRVLVSCSTGQMSKDQVREALAPLGWLPAEGNAAFVEAKTADVLEHLPPEVSEELAATDPILIEVRNGVWGFCSLERQEVLNFRLLGEHIDRLQDVAEAIVSRVPEAVSEVSGESVSFPEPIEIRKRENEDRLAHGLVRSRRTLSFREYVQEERARERRLVATFLILFAVASAASVAAFFLWDDRTGDYIRGWLDRSATALAVAILTTTINLLFEYRDWRRKETFVEWHFGKLNLRSG